MIAVVIPYFQRAPGVLRNALASIAAQHDLRVQVHVIVVDDESPAPAEPEVAAIQWPPGFLANVIRRPNGGPGAARNTGLDAVPAGTEYVAFLDSDDEWSEDHLARAVSALAQGFDFYFADLYQLGQTIGAFERGGRIRVDDHPLLPGSLPGLHAYQGDMMDQIIRGNLIGTPTVVFRHGKFGQLRFRTEYTTAGEDYLFWMELTTAGARIAFSSKVEATCGRGVNVYAGSGWGTDQFMLRVHNEMRYRKSTLKLFRLSPAQREHIASAVSDLRTAFARDVLHRLAHRKPLARALLLAQWRLDPLSWAKLPLVAVRQLIGR